VNLRINKEDMVNDNYGSKGAIERSVDLTKDSKTKRWDQIINENRKEYWEELSSEDFKKILRRVCKPDKINKDDEE
jgi:hypothetical protein